MASAGEARADGEAAVLEEWGWPKEPYEPETLKQYVLDTCKKVEEERRLSLKGCDVKLTAFKGVSEEAYKAGKWFSFMNHKGDCRVYVHNYTRDITAVRPPNFHEMTEEEKRAVAQLGFYTHDLPDELEKVYRRQAALPLVLASEETCEALVQFANIDAKSKLLDATKLRKINPAVLEDARRSIVYAMKEGATLWVWLGDNNMPLFESKVCTSKNRDKVPLGLFVHGGLEPEMVREKIYRDEDLENGECKMKPGFKVVFLARYDNFMHLMSSMMKAALQDSLPYFDSFQVVKAYNEADKLALLSRMRKEDLEKAEEKGLA